MFISGWHAALVRRSEISVQRETAEIMVAALGALGRLERSSPQRSGQLRLALAKARAAVRAGQLPESDFRRRADAILREASQELRTPHTRPQRSAAHHH